jgi:radical SAM protein with 4Fe4S-binding SPASM domain
MISFFITTRCNLSCLYCYTNKNAGEHRHQTLDLEFAKAGIDDYYKSSTHHHVRFFGAGEPTEELDLIKEILMYAQSKDGDTTSEIQTNGCFSLETAKWISKNIDIVWISSDGYPEIQDYFRPTKNFEPSSSRLSRNLSYFSTHKKEMVGIRLTISNKNVDKQIEILDYFAQFGIKNFWADLMFPSIGSEKTIDTVDLDLFTNEFIAAVRYAVRRGMTYGSILTCNFNEPGHYACRTCLPVPHLTTDGYISACDMALFGNDADHMSAFIYGKWDKEIKSITYDQKKIQDLQRRKLENMPNCVGCEVGPYCRGYCLGEVMNETKDLFGCKSQLCASIKKMFKELTDEEKSYTYTHP